MKKRIASALSWRRQQCRELIRQHGWSGRRWQPDKEYEDWRRGCRWRRVCFQYDAELGWAFIPNRKARLYHDGTFYVHRTNAAGMRADQDYPLEAPSDRRRLIVLGDSYTAGDGVSNGLRFTDRIDASCPGLDVLNFGLPGAGPLQQLLLYRKHASKYEADAVMLCLSCENVRRLACRIWPALEWSSQTVVYRAKPFAELDGDELRIRNVPVPRGVRREDALGDWGDLGGALSPDGNPYAAYESPDHPLLRLLSAVLEQFLEQATGRPVMLVVLPTAAFIMGQPPTYLDYFRSFATPHRNALTLIDALPAFTALDLPVRRQCWFRHDPHFTSFAHERLAEYLMDAMSERAPELVKDRVDRSTS